ncbi:MAG: sugar phosphate isomerase/epimerase family protein [Geminicoccaceae bacterium]
MAERPIAGVGFATIGEHPDLSGLDRALGRIEDVGATHAELALFAADLLANGRILPGPRRRLEAICARRRLCYTAHGVLAVNFMDEANLDLHRAVCRATIELAAGVGATVLVQHPGMLTTPVPPAEIERLHAVERDAWRQMGDHAARFGLRIAVETLFVENEHEYTAEPERLAAEIRAVGHPHVTGTLDVSHSYLMSSFRNTRLADAVRAFAPVTGHFHLHDSFGRPPGSLSGFYTDSERLAFGVGDLHLPFGWGDIPFADLLPGLPVEPGSVFTVELPERHWGELEACARFAFDLMERMNAAA